MAIVSTGSPRLSDQQQQWLADLYRTNFATVARLCTGILRNAEDGADAAHETFLIAAKSMEPDVSPKVARSWLLTVARNHCVDVLRRRKRHGRALVTLGGNPDSGADIESRVVDRDFANVVLSHLSDRERQALWQSAVESRPMADIATGLNLSYMAAAQVLHRARRHAASTAARIAVVIGLVRLGRALKADRLLALAAVPLAVIAIQSSSSVTPAAAESNQRAQPFTTITVVGTAPSLGQQPIVPSPGGTGALVSGAANPLPATGILPSSATSALSNAVASLRRSIDGLPVPTRSVPALPVPTPSLPQIVP